MHTPSAPPLAWAGLVDQAIAIYRAHWRTLLGLAACWWLVSTVLDGYDLVPAVVGAISDPGAWGRAAPRALDPWSWLEGILAVALSLVANAADRR